MSRIVALVLVFVVTLSLGACCTPTVPTIEKSRVISADFDTTWKASVAVAAETGIPVAEIEKDSGLIVFQNFRFGDRDAKVQCVPMLWVVEPNSNLGNGNLFVVEQDGGGTLVTLNATYRTQISQSSMSGKSFQWMDATPTGEMERAVLDAIEAKIRVLGN